MRTITPGKGHQQMALKVGEQIGVQVLQRGHTGYLWAIEGDMPVQLSLVDDGLVRDGPSPAVEAEDAAGVPRVFVFEAKRPGEAIINLSERLAWEAEECPAQRAVIALTIRN